MTAEELPWHELTPSARRLLKDLAELFLDGEQYEVKITISQGGARRTGITLDPETLRSIRGRET